MSKKIKLYGKTFLREHPDGNSIEDPYREKGGASIFAGDDLVFHTKLDRTHLSGNPALYNFHSVRFSIIAQKPNIFTGVFSSVFDSTREFVLDSFGMDFDDTTAPLIAWGVDGNARRLNFESNRNFNLPDGDFRKLISIYTKHPNSTNWEYNFVFPAIFRWDYWKALGIADNDFYDSAEINNNKNHDWKHYHIPSALPFGWKIKYKFEIDYTYSRGTRKTYYSEINLSPEQISINGFNSNPDFINKSIKSCKVGGTPINAPAVILGDENTEVYAYFEKATAWENIGVSEGEKNNISATFWVEPFEGLGYSTRSIASTIYPSTSESVFKGERSVMLFDNGDRMLFDNGDYMCYDNSGKAGEITFDISDSKKITVKSEIDFTKLKAKYSGINKFTLYCRLYNSSTRASKVITTLGAFNIAGEIYPTGGSSYNYVVNGILSGATLESISIPDGWNILTTSAISGGSQTFNILVGSLSGTGTGTIKLTYVKSNVFYFLELDVNVGVARLGESIKQTLTYIPSVTQSAPSVFCGSSTDEVLLNVYGDVANQNIDERNDNKGFYYYGNASINNITLKLQKKLNGNWSDVHTIVDNTYGNYFAYGNSPNFLPSSFVDDFGKKYTGIFLRWVKVLNTLGEGVYRMTIEKTDIFAVVHTSFSFETFCLAQWNCNSLEGTIKIQIFTQGIIGTLNEMDEQIDYDLGWNDEIRLNGIASWSDPSYKIEYNEYGDSQFNSFNPIINEQNAKGKLQIVSSSGYVDRFINTNIFQADKILITDFNSKNRFTFVRVPIILDNVKTSEQKYGVEKVLLDLDFSYGRNNLRKRNSF